jgi:hypothetical protein
MERRPPYNVSFSQNVSVREVSFQGCEKIDPLEVRAEVHRSLSSLLDTKQHITAKLEELNQAELNINEERSQFQQVLTSYLMNYLDRVGQFVSSKQRKLGDLSKEINEKIYMANDLVEKKVVARGDKDISSIVRHIQVCISTCNEELKLVDTMPELDPFGHKRLQAFETQRLQLVNQHDLLRSQLQETQKENEELRDLVAELTMQKDAQAALMLQQARTLEQAREGDVATAAAEQQRLVAGLETERERDRKGWQEKESQWKARVLALERKWHEDKDSKMQRWLEREADLARERADLVESHRAELRAKDAELQAVREAAQREKDGLRAELERVRSSSESRLRSCREENRTDFAALTTRLELAEQKSSQMHTSLVERQQECERLQAKVRAFEVEQAEVPAREEAAHVAQRAREAALRDELGKRDAALRLVGQQAATRERELQSRCDTRLSLLAQEHRRLVLAVRRDFSSKLMHALSATFARYSPALKRLVACLDLNAGGSGSAPKITSTSMNTSSNSPLILPGRAVGDAVVHSLRQLRASTGRIPTPQVFPAFNATGNAASALPDTPRSLGEIAAFNNVNGTGVNIPITPTAAVSDAAAVTLSSALPLLPLPLTPAARNHAVSDRTNGSVDKVGEFESDILSDPSARSDPPNAVAGEKLPAAWASLFTTHSSYNPEMFQLDASLALELDYAIAGAGVGGGDESKAGGEEQERSQDATLSNFPSLSLGPSGGVGAGLREFEALLEALHRAVAGLSEQVQHQLEKGKERYRLALQRLQRGHSEQLASLALARRASEGQLARENKRERLEGGAELSQALSRLAALSEELTTARARADAAEAQLQTAVDRFASQETALVEKFTREKVNERESHLQQLHALAGQLAEQLANLSAAAADLSRTKAALHAAESRTETLTKQLFDSESRAETAERRVGELQDATVQSFYLMHFGLQITDILYKYVHLQIELYDQNC